MLATHRWKWWPHGHTDAGKNAGHTGIVQESADAAQQVGQSQTTEESDVGRHGMMTEDDCQHWQRVHGDCSYTHGVLELTQNHWPDTFLYWRVEKLVIVDVERTKMELTGKPEQQRFTIRSGVVTGTSSRRRGAISVTVIVVFEVEWTKIELTGKPKQQKFRIRSGVLTSTSIRRHSAIRVKVIVVIDVEWTKIERCCWVFQTRAVIHFLKQTHAHILKRCLQCIAMPLPPLPLMKSACGNFLFFDRNALIRGNRAMHASSCSCAFLTEQQQKKIWANKDGWMSTLSRDQAQTASLIHRNNNRCLLMYSLWVGG